jgi:MSHA pilin protein MshA
MKKAQGGFTLIELVVVMVILGILAAVALPKFVDMSSQARQAKMNGALGSVKSATALIHAQWLAAGSPTATAAGTTITYEGGTLDVYSDMAYGYPKGTAIVNLAGLDSSFSVSPAATATTATIVDASKTTCTFTYTAATSTSVPPSYTVTGISSTTC